MATPLGPPAPRPPYCTVTVVESEFPPRSGHRGWRLLLDDEYLYWGAWDELDIACWWAAWLMGFDPIRALRGRGHPQWHLLAW